MDTLGNVVDKLFTVNLKKYYRVTADGPGSKVLSNLVSQSDKLSDEINDLSAKVISGDMSDDDAMRPQHKTY